MGTAHHLTLANLHVAVGGAHRTRFAAKERPRHTSIAIVTSREPIFPHPISTGRVGQLE